MGVDLIGIRRSYNWQGWRALYTLGVLFGWKPAGTLYPNEPVTYLNSYPPDDDPGPRNGYFTNDFQWVTEPDAAAWAAAIYRALAPEKFDATQKILASQDPPANLDSEHAAWLRDFADAASKHGFCIT
jgi:hypothetical protein